jgi:uncharacterized protein HemY
MRFLFKALSLIILTLITGNWLLDDVGYVLIRYHDIAIETSLLIAILAGMSFLLVMAWLIRIFPARNLKQTQESKQASVEENVEAKHSLRNSGKAAQLPDK